MCKDFQLIIFVLLWAVGLFCQVRARRYPNPAVPDAQERLGWTTRWVRPEDLSPRGVRLLWYSYGAVFLVFAFITFWPLVC